MPSQDTTPPGYDQLAPFWGDIHNHCDVSYGHGSLDDALRNARTQLDFVSVTAHAHWPDLPPGDGHLARVHAYHRAGFERALDQWPRYQEVMNAANADGEFVTLQSFEWHSLQSGDHNVYFKGDDGDIIPADDLADMRRRLRNYRARGIHALLIPHHIGYLQGYRGINWNEFTSEFSPFAEIYSMHGAAESDVAPYPYLHTMGPRDSGSTLQTGLAAGHVVGTVGSTDSHSAHPGSYGHGRMGVWAESLTRKGIWDALTSRRTWALTGDNIQLAFSVNGHPMGSQIPHNAEREVQVSVVGGDALDYVEVLHNNRVVERWSVVDAYPDEPDSDVKVGLELGWGELDEPVDWLVDLHVRQGQLLHVEPRFRGWDIVSPQQELSDAFVFSTIERQDEHHIRFTTRSWRNPTTVSPATQGIGMRIAGDDRTVITGTINDRPVEIPLASLRKGTSTGYLGGFLTPAFQFRRAVPRSAFTLSRSLTHRGTHGKDWYYVRVKQRNDQWAWSSPIWVRGHDDRA